MRLARPCRIFLGRRAGAGARRPPPHGRGVEWRASLKKRDRAWGREGFLPAPEPPPRRRGGPGRWPRRRGGPRPGSHGHSAHTGSLSDGGHEGGRRAGARPGRGAREVSGDRRLGGGDDPRQRGKGDRWISPPPNGRGGHSAPTTHDHPGTPWRRHAEALADWTLARVVVRRDVYGTYYQAGGQFKQMTAHAPLTRNVLIRHYRGEATIGTHLISPDNLCTSVAADIDAHDDSADPDRNWRCASRRPSTWPATGSGRWSSTRTAKAASTPGRSSRSPSPPPSPGGSARSSATPSRPPGSPPGSSSPSRTA